MKCTGKDLRGRPCVVVDIVPGDLCCYSCGTLVAQELQVPSQAVLPIVEPPFLGCPECLRQGRQSPGQNERGFCLADKTLCRPPLRDNFMIELGEWEAVLSNLGIVHRHNDDYGLVAVRKVNGVQTRWAWIGDGLSRARKAAMASKVACEDGSRMMEAMLIEGSFDPRRIIAQSIAAAQNAVLELPDNPESQDTNENGQTMKPPMTTIVVVLQIGDRIYIGWAGDSRVYAVYARNGKCGARRLTRDDTYLEQLRKKGMTYKQAMADPTAQQMSQCLGLRPRRYAGAEFCRTGHGAPGGHRPLH